MHCWTGSSPGHGLLPVRKQAITQTNVLLSTGFLQTNSNDIWIKKHCCEERALENVLCKLMVILIIWKYGLQNFVHFFQRTISWCILKLFAVDIHWVPKLNQIGPIVYLWLNKVSANERKLFICNVFSHWLRFCSAIDRKQALVSCLHDNKLLSNFLCNRYPGS